MDALPYANTRLDCALDSIVPLRYGFIVGNVSLTAVLASSSLHGNSKSPCSDLSRDSYIAGAF